MPRGKWMRPEKGTIHWKTPLGSPTKRSCRCERDTRKKTVRERERAKERGVRERLRSGRQLRNNDAFIFYSNMFGSIVTGKNRRELLHQDVV